MLFHLTKAPPVLFSDSSGFLFLLYPLLSWIISPVIFSLFQIMTFHWSLLLLPGFFGSFIYLCRYVLAPVCMEGKGQFSGVGLLRSSCGVQGLSFVIGPACRAYTCWAICRAPFPHSSGGSFFPPPSTSQGWFDPVWEAHCAHIQGPHSSTTVQSGRSARDLRT